MSRRKVRFGDYEVDFTRRELRKYGLRVKLERKPFCVLELLLRCPGELVTRKELVECLWPDSHVSFAHGLNTAVNSLRHVLGDSSRNCQFIETRPGLGYRFSAPVKEVSESETDGKPRHGSGKNVGAQEDCLKGRYFLNRMAEEEIYQAIAYFKSAAGEETNCSLAHAGMADAYCQLASTGSVCPSKVAGQARSSAELALKYDPELADAQVAAGRVKMLFDWDWNGTRIAVNRALTLDSSSVPARMLDASLLCTLGCYQAALAVCRQAIALDPLSFPAKVQLAACLYAAREFQSAANQCWDMLTLTPRFAPAQILLALSYERLSLYEEAAVEFQNARQCAGFQPAAIAGLGQVLAVAGLEREAEQVFVELCTQAESRYVSPYCHALICAGRRQTSQTFSFLEECFRLRDPALLWLQTDARFDYLRETERFQTMLGRLGTRDLGAESAHNMRAALVS